MTLADKIALAAKYIDRSRSLAVLTGAGVSKESGVPTFRDALEGLWARYDPQELATPYAFRNNPKLVWDWYEYRREIAGQAQPNPGHYALAALEALLPEVIVITQNVDDLHRRAGSADIIPLHGALMRSKCSAGCQGDPTLLERGDLQLDDSGDGPPRCPHCGAYARPDVVWFGETLPQAELQRAMEVSRRVDLMLVVGTSGVVQPAASMPFLAKRANATVIEVNPVQSEITPIADIWLDGPSGEVLPQVLDALRARRQKAPAG